jgi:hypothetical protein
LFKKQPGIGGKGARVKGTLSAQVMPFAWTKRSVSHGFFDCSECEFKSTRDSKMEIMSRSNDSMPYYEITIETSDEL